MKFLIALTTLLAMAYADHEFRIENNCNFEIWPGMLNNPGKSLPENGGFALGAHQTHTYHVPDEWAGQVWGRTECNAQGACVTGDCGECSRVVIAISLIVSH